MTKHDDQFDGAMIRIVREARRIFPDDLVVCVAIKELEDKHAIFRKLRLGEYRLAHDALEDCRNAEEHLQDVVRKRLGNRIE